jgi:hypothetical protein
MTVVGREMREADRQQGGMFSYISAGGEIFLSENGSRDTFGRRTFCKSCQHRKMRHAPA